MGKSSYSSKRKRSKYSSPGPTKKRSKIRRAKSRKLRPRDDSDSYSSDDSRSLASVSSSSEDSYRSRKSRSRIRKDVKVAKRRARSHSSSSEEYHRLRKRKQSRRKIDSEVKKTTRRNKKKKSLRDASISSRSSGSWSCSTCQSTDESSNESEYERHRGRSQRRGNNLRRLKKVKSRSKKRRYRSRSCSSCSRHRLRSCSSSSEHRGNDYWNQEKVTDGNTSKRLRSVITFTKNDKEARELDLDENKEEIVYESDGYPSGRSNDSNDGESKVLRNQSHDAFERKRPIENEKREDACVSNFKTAQPLDCCKDGSDDYVESKTSHGVFAKNDALEEKTNEISKAIDHVNTGDVESKPSCGVFGKNDALEEKSNQISKATDNMNAGDLELVLRQKALENLRRFREATQIIVSTSNKNGKSNEASKSPSPKKVDLSQNEYAEDDGAQGVGGDFVHYEEQEKILDGSNGGNISVSVKNNAFPPNKVAVAGRGRVNSTVDHGINKQRLVTSALKQALSNATHVIGSAASQVSDKVKLSTGNSVGDHNVTCFSGSVNDNEIDNAIHSASARSSPCLASAERDAGLNKLQDEDKKDLKLEPKTVASLKPPRGGDNDKAVINDPGSSSAEHSSHVMTAGQVINSTEGQEDGKEGSQLQQKTMSVMRGGEMVQVSYKVYIPKKASTLARRQLKR